MALMVWLRAVTLWATNSPRTSDAPPTVSVKTSHIELFFYTIKKETCQHDSLDLTDIPVQFLSPIVESPESIIIIIIILYYATGKRRLLWEKGEINDSGISASWWEVRKMEQAVCKVSVTTVVLLRHQVRMKRESIHHSNSPVIHFCECVKLWRERPVLFMQHPNRRLRVL